jgi:ribosome maturation protein Sdo1
MANEKAVQEFRVPTDLLKQFQSEVRFVPRELHPNGYIIFDRMMLQKVLLSDDARVRKELVEQLERLEKNGGQLVIVSK